MVTILKTLYPNKIGISVVRGIRGRDLSTPYLYIIGSVNELKKSVISIDIGRKR